LTKAKEHNVGAEKEANAPPEGQEQVDPRLQDAELAKKQKEGAILDQKMAHANDKHAKEMEKSDTGVKAEKLKTGVDLALKTAKTKQEMDLKEKTTKHGMKIKEKTAKAAAKQKPAKGGDK